MDAKLLKLDNKRSPERQALAAAIAHRDGAERELAVAREAVRQARGKRFKAQDRLDTLRAAREEDAAAQSLGAVFIASAREAVKASGVVPSLLDGLAALHDELDKRLSALAYLRFKNVITEVDMEPVLAAVRRPVLLGDYHPICAAWTTVFKTLAQDSDAELPQ